MNEAKRELRDLIRSKLTADMTPDDATEALIGIFDEVDDEWDVIDASTYSEPEKHLHQRSLVARIPRQSVTVRADRAIQGE